MAGRTRPQSTQSRNIAAVSSAERVRSGTDWQRLPSVAAGELAPSRLPGSLVASLEHPASGMSADSRTYCTMLDKQFIRHNPDAVKRAVQVKGVDLDVDELLELD